MLPHDLDAKVIMPAPYTETDVFGYLLGEEFVIITDEALRVRSVADLGTDMANVGARHCRIGVVRWADPKGLS